MLGAPTSFWAKLSLDPETQTPTAWHPLEDHCADVGACCEAILRETGLRHRLARVAGLVELTHGQIARLSALATLHDLGKANIGFQNKSLPAGTPGRFTAGHVAEVMALLNRPDYEAHEKLLQALPVIELESWTDDPDGGARLLLAAVCHHGKPVPLCGIPDRRCWRPSRGLDPFEAIRSLVTCIRAWFPEAFEPDARPLPTAPVFQHAFSGLVMLADWLGSDQSRFFPFSQDASDRMHFARERAREALRWIGMAPQRSRITLGSQAPGFHHIAPFSPRSAQRATLELPASEAGSLTLLEAETGAGKTEAALARYLRLFHAGSVDGLYFALPTRTAATQIHERVRLAIQRAFPEGARPPVSLAVPGYIVVDDRSASRDDLEGRRLPVFEVLWPDDPRDLLRYRGWASEHPKRYLAGNVVVGTIDQALFSCLTVTHAHMRASALLRLLLVVDEVHASDAYMNRLLEAVLEHHLAAGGHALLMSATLGTATAQRLLSTAGPPNLPAPHLDDTHEVPFPAITFRAVGGEAVRISAPTEAPVKQVSVELSTHQDSPAVIAKKALDAAEDGAKVLVLRNTVASCVATQLAVEREAEARGIERLLFRCRAWPSPHHSRFAAEDRELLDRAIEAEIGKERPTGGVVAVATQTVQQSLDLDADLLITDLCPMDVLLQRIGRLHRHARTDRAAGFDRARVVVLVPEDRDLSARIRRNGTPFGTHGLGTVYTDLRILETTWRLLTETERLDIPTMNRELVEATTHPEALEGVTAELGGSWPDHQRWLTGRFYSDRRVADLNLLDRTVPFGEARFPPAETRRKVQTRLGEDDRLARFDPPPTGPFEIPIRSLRLPAFLASGIPAEAEPEVMETGCGVVRFRWRPHSFVYDRLGLRPEGTLEDEEVALDA